MLNMLQNVVNVAKSGSLDMYVIMGEILGWIFSESVWLTYGGAYCSENIYMFQFPSLSSNKPTLYNFPHFLHFCVIDS